MIDLKWIISLLFVFWHPCEPFSAVFAHRHGEHQCCLSSEHTRFGRCRCSHKDYGGLQSILIDFWLYISCPLFDHCNTSVTDPSASTSLAGESTDPAHEAVHGETSQTMGSGGEDPGNCAMCTQQLRVSLLMTWHNQEGRGAPSWVPTPGTSRSREGPTAGGQELSTPQASLRAGRAPGSLLWDP